MKPFQSRLARILRIRAIQEEALRSGWLTAERAAAAANSRRDEARSVAARVARELRDQLGRVPPQTTLLFQRTVDRAEHHTRRASEMALTKRLQADALRAPWEAARQRVRGLERLEEKRADARRRLEARREQREIDEIAISMARGRRAAKRASGRRDRTTDRPDLS